MKKERKYSKVNELETNLTNEAKSEIQKLTAKSKEDKKIQDLKNEYEKTIEKADNIKEEIIQKLEEKADNFEKKEGFRILGVKPWKVMAYFVIYSFLGFCIETIYGLLTKGVIESRQSFLYGPFCGIYGFGAVVMILLLQYFMKNNYTLFAGGYVIGSAIEYFVSLFGEMILHVKWWDYSTEPFNIGGRVCLFYSIAWGILAIYLMRNVNPRVEGWINKIKKKLPKYLLPVVADISIVFLLFDGLISMYAMNIFYARLVHDYSIDIANKSHYEETYERILSKEKKKNFTEKHFSNEKMLKTYPNLKFENTSGEIVFVKEILSDIQPYYIKVFTPKGKVHLTNVETVTYNP